MQQYVSNNDKSRIKMPIAAILWTIFASILPIEMIMNITAYNPLFLILDLVSMHAYIFLIVLLFMKNRTNLLCIPFAVLAGCSTVYMFYNIVDYFRVLGDGLIPIISPLSLLLSLIAMYVLIIVSVLMNNKGNYSAKNKPIKVWFFVLFGIHATFACYLKALTLINILSHIAEGIYSEFLLDNILGIFQTPFFVLAILFTKLWIDKPYKTNLPAPEYHNQMYFSDSNYGENNNYSGYNENNSYNNYNDNYSNYNNYNDYNNNNNYNESNSYDNYSSYDNYNNNSNYNDYNS